MSLPMPDLDDVGALRARLRGDEPCRQSSPTGPSDDEPWETGRFRWAVPGRTAVAAGVVLLVLVAGLAVLLWRGGPGDVVPMPDLALASAAAAHSAGGALAHPAEGEPPEPVAQDAPDTAAAPATLLVHVVGQVREPGVVRLPPGARVVDAIEAAGGATRKSDLAALNLAAPVVDGEQVRVPRPGESQAAAPAATTADGGEPGSPGASGTIDLNAADAAVLDTLPGVGPVIAERIVSHREQHGPFASVEALQDVSGIGPATFARLREQVHVG